VAKHSTNLGHCIQLHDTTIHSTKPRYIDQVIREAIKIKLHLNNMNREDVAFASAGHRSPSSTLSKDVGCIDWSIASSYLATSPF
jgi:hypothetical protein